MTIIYTAKEQFEMLLKDHISLGIMKFDNLDNKDQRELVALFLQAYPEQRDFYLSDIEDQDYLLRLVEKFMMTDKRNDGIEAMEVLGNEVAYLYETQINVLFDEYAYDHPSRVNEREQYADDLARHIAADNRQRL